MSENLGIDKETMEAFKALILKVTEAIRNFDVKKIDFFKLGYEKGRADAIDDFVNALLYGRDKAGVEILVFSEDAREKLLKMAEQLKEQEDE